MKSAIKLILGTCVTALSVMACEKDVKRSEPQEGGFVTIRAFLPDDTREASVKTGISWTWQEGDILTITGENTEVFKIKEGFSPKQAEFTGKAVKGDSFSIAYPSMDAVDWTAQTQKGNNNSDHLRYVAVLEGVDTYTTFSFNPEWAAEHGGSIRQTGVLKYMLTFPDKVSSVSSITLSGTSPIFYAGNDETLTDCLTLTLQNVTLSPGETLVGWMTTSWNESAVPSGTVLTIEVKAGSETLTREITFSRDAALRSGVVNTFTLTASAWDSGEEPPTPLRYAGGSGTETDPWIVTTPEMMGYIGEDLVSGETRWFKLGTDIDMTGVEWTPLNVDNPYDKRIDLDGAGFTISNLGCSAATYPGLFGVLYGNCHDLNITGASITAGGSSAGILGGYGGTSGKPCVVTNVHVQGTVSGTAVAGGLLGSAREATITGCSADVDVHSTGLGVGGIIGIDTGVATISDCWTAGSIISDTQVAGGIAGDLRTEGSSVYNCFSGATVKAQFYAGGIVGRANKNSKGNATNNESLTPGNHVEKCIAWNESIESTATDGSEHYSIGAIVGSTAIKNYLADCFRKANLKIVECPANAEKGYAPVDQENASPDNPLVKGTGTYNYAYYGKAAASGASLTSVAQALGWSSTIWDFSGDVPGHVSGAVWTPESSDEPDEPENQDTTGQLPDYGENEFYSE